MILPIITAEEEKKHLGKCYIALDGKVLAYDKDILKAFKKAKKVVPNLHEEKFLMARIHPKYIVA